MFNWCIFNFSGCDNVMGVELCIRQRDHVVIVMPYFPHEKFQVRIDIFKLFLVTLVLFLDIIFVGSQRVCFCGFSI